MDQRSELDSGNLEIKFSATKTGDTLGKKKMRVLPGIVLDY